MRWAPFVGDKVCWVPEKLVGVVTRVQGSCARVEFFDGSFCFIHKHFLADEPFREGEEVIVRDGGGRRTIQKRANGYALTLPKEGKDKEPIWTHECLLKAIPPKRG